MVQEQKATAMKQADFVSDALLQLTARSTTAPVGRTEVGWSQQGK